MNLNQILSVLILAGAIAFGVSVFIAPKLEDKPKERAASLTEPGLGPNREISARDGLAIRATYRRSADGHYWAKTEVNGLTLDFLIDTGAGPVALTYEDAKRLGLDPDNLDYSRPVGTAGGETMAAPVKLDYIRLGQVRIDDVNALVIRDGLKQNLLGMSVLGDLYSIELRGDRLIIRN